MRRAFKSLLAISADAKTVKGQKKGIMTGILYLAPADISGFNVCPKATDGCKAACLFTAGRGVYDMVRSARIAKTMRFFNDREQFMLDLVESVRRLVVKAQNANMIPACRLNGTSDIAWEKFKVIREGKVYGSIMEAFPKVKFYDYTAILGRKKALSLKNYHLTFSLKENNDKDARKAIEQGYNLSVVLNVKRKAVKPKVWSGIPVIDGDKDDVRFKDRGKGKIVALTAKGKARYDTSGFVRQVDSQLA